MADVMRACVGSKGPNVGQDKVQVLDSKWAKRHQDYISKRGKKGERKHQVLMMHSKEQLLIFLERNFRESRLGRVLD